MHGHHAFLVRAIRAAEEIALGFNAVADDFAAAMRAFRRQRVNRAFKTVEIVRSAVPDDFQRLVVIVSTNFTAHMHHSCLSRFQASRVASISWSCSASATPSS